MHRRDFIVTALDWLRYAGLMVLLPAFFRPRVVAAKNDIDLSIIDQLTLREISEQQWHHGKKRFKSPFPGMPHGNPFRVLRWKLFSRNHHKPLYKNERVLPVALDWEPVMNHTGVSLTFINHSSVLINDNGTILLIDPVLDGLLPFIRDFTPLTFEIKDMPKPDHLLITHGHYDHLDKASLKRFDINTHVISPLGYDGIFEDLGMHNRHRLDWFESYRSNRLEIVLLPSRHWTMRNPIIGPNRSLWGGYLIKTSTGFNIFLSGDTAYHNRYAELGQEASIDLAIFNLGAYEPRWFMKSSHINPLETVQAFSALKAKKLAVIHWGTFRLGNEPVYLPPLEMKNEMEKAGMADRLLPIPHGQTVYF